MQIETPRLIMRDFVEDDWAAVLAYQRDPRYLRFNSWSERTEDDAREFVGWFLAQQVAQPRIKFQLAITLRADGRLIGSCGIRRDKPTATEADIGYELDPAMWGQGYASEAARAIVDWGFAELKVHRIWAACVAENEASARVLARLGMRHEGRLREREHFKGRWWDTLIYAVLEHEWAKQP